MSITKEDFEKQLDLISLYNGIPYGRAYRLFDKEDKHTQACLKFKGYLALSDAFKCLFLETIELINMECRPKLTKPLSEFYVLFIPRLFNSFQSLCGSERIAIKGYPLQAYSLLRNTFDNLVLVSAVAQGMTDFEKIEGIEEGKQIDLKSIKKVRKNIELEIRKKMTGSKSGLDQDTLDELIQWDALFDLEVHGSRLSIADTLSWMKGQSSLPVLPEFQERKFAMFMNRYCEIAWLVHRLLPLIQFPEVPLGDSWKEKWRIIDDVFKMMISSLTKELGKKIGAAIVVFVTKKFPFNENSMYPDK